MSTTRFYSGPDANESSEAFQRRCQEIHLQSEVETPLPEGEIIVCVACDKDPFACRCTLEQIREAYESPA